jgi:hypothetical protein
MSQQENHSPANHISLPRPNATVWVSSAFCAALGLAVLVLVALGPGKQGTDAALRVTARFSITLPMPLRLIF